MPEEFYSEIRSIPALLFQERALLCKMQARMGGKRKTARCYGRLQRGKREHPSQHKAHGEQPPAAARARGFAAKNAPAGQRQIKNHVREKSPDWTGNLRQPPPRLRLKTASGKGSRSAYSTVLTSPGFIVRLRRLRCLSPGHVHFRVRQFPSRHTL